MTQWLRADTALDHLRDQRGIEPFAVCLAILAGHIRCRYAGPHPRPMLPPPSLCRLEARSLLRWVREHEAARVLH